MKLTTLPALALAFALGFGTAAPATAATYTTLDAAASHITFGYSQMNVKMDGSFGEISAKELQFDPAKPEAAKVTLEIKLASVDAGYAEANTELEKAEWLNLAAHPLATFTSSSVKALGNNKFEVAGALSIKGNAQDIVVPVTFTEKDGKGEFEGQFTFKRGDFKIGEGEWADFSIVANDIQVKFHIVTTP